MWRAAFAVVAAALFHSAGCSAPSDSAEPGRRPHPASVSVFSPSGKLLETTEYDSQGRRHGISRQFAEDGTLEVETEFQHDVWVRISVYWPDGHLRELGEAGLFSDTWKYWDEHGNALAAPAPAAKPKRTAIENEALPPGL